MQGRPARPGQVAVGRVRRAVGLGGDVLVEVRTDEPGQRFATGAMLRTEHGRRLTVRAARPRGAALVVGFVEVTDRTAAEDLAGTLLVVDVAALPPPADPEEFRDHQLIGLTVQDRTGRRLGTVSDVLHGPAGALLEVALGGPGDGPGNGPGDAAGDGPGDGPGDGIPGRAALVPFVRRIVPEVDLAAGLLVVDPPSGLLEL